MQTAFVFLFRMKLQFAWVPFKLLLVESIQIFESFLVI